MMKRSLTLPCTAFEELLLAQDSEAYPCNIYLRLRLVGKLDQDKFTESVVHMLEHHPMLRAKLRTRFGRSSWLIQEVSAPLIHWTSSESDCWKVPEEARIDLHRETGIKISVAEQHEPTQEHPDRVLTQVAFKLHHAVADGLGIASAIDDLWLAYDGLVHRGNVNLPERAAELLPLRNRFTPGLSKLLRLIPQQVVGLAGIRQYLMRRPSPIVDNALPIRTTLPKPSFDGLTYHCSKEVTEGLGRKAKRQGISLNAMLAACVFHGVSEFRADQGVQTDGNWLRMMVPVNLRNTAELRQLPACNVVSCVFLDRTPIQIGEFASLARSVHEEMELIKSKSLALLFILSVWIRKLTRFRSKKTEIKRCQTSFVFSNLGKGFCQSSLCGDQQQVTTGKLLLESIEAFAPLTPFMNAAFSSLMYGKQLRLMLRFDSRFLKEDHARQLMGMIAKQLEQLTQQEPLES